MVNIAHAHYNDIVSIEVIGMERSNMVFSEVPDVVSVTFLGLTHHVFSVDIEVSIFNGSLHVSVMVVFVLLRNFFLHKFKFLTIYLAVADYVTEELHSCVSIVLEHFQSVAGLLSASSGLVVTTQVLN